MSTTKAIQNLITDVKYIQEEVEEVRSNPELVNHLGWVVIILQTIIDEMPEGKTR